MRVNTIIQARMGSTRLPGKVLMPLEGRPVLSWVVRAAQQADVADTVVVATTADTADDPVAELGMSLGAAVVRGSEDDVLARFVQACDEHPCDAFVRLTADCPLLDAVIIRMAVAVFVAACGDLDYVCTFLPRSLPRGLDVEVASTNVLREMHLQATGHHRIHVTSGIYAGGARYRIAGVNFQPAADDLRVTLDTHEDHELLVALTALLGDAVPSWRAVVSALRGRPDLVALNADVRQKGLTDG